VVRGDPAGPKTGGDRLDRVEGYLAAVWYSPTLGSS